MPAAAPIHPWEQPSRNWQRLHLDHAGPFHGRYFLILKDARSKWAEVIQVCSTTTAATISALRPIFARFGVPEHIISDNGTAFTSDEFREFCESEGIRHSTSSPYHPRSNGLAENFVKTFKSAIGKRSITQQELDIRLNKFLLVYRNTPNAATGRSPAEMLLGARVPMAFDLLYPKSVEDYNQEVQKQMANRNVTKVREFQIHDPVKLRFKDRWYDGFVTDKRGPLTYLVQCSSLGRVLKLHVDHLRSRTSAGEEEEEEERDQEKVERNFALKDPIWHQDRPIPSVEQPIPVPEIPVAVQEQKEVKLKIPKIVLKRIEVKSLPERQLSGAPAAETVVKLAKANEATVPPATEVRRNPARTARERGVEKLNL